MKLLGLLVLLFGVLSVSAFRGMPQRSFSGTQLTMNLQQNCKQITKALGVGALSFLVSGAPLNYIQSDGMVSLVQPAAADVRAQQKRTYFRFAPKFNEGKEYYKNEVKAAIDKDDFTVVSKLFENFVTKVNRNTDQETTDTYANVHYTRPMTLLGGTFAERGTSAKTRALQEQEALFITAMQKLEGTTKNMKGEGFFAADIKMPTGSERTKQAKEAWAEGKAALNAYVDIFNEGLMLELNKLPTV